MTERERVFPAAALACAVLWAVGAPAARAQVRVSPQDEKLPEGMKPYQTKYYTIYTDLDADTVREAAARVTAMAEEYYNRTKGFAGVIRQRLPFYLFSKAADYHLAGGPGGSAGVYMARGNSGKLMAIAPKGGAFTWHVVQHEGFHQFAHMVMTPRLPIWVNEGLAEYFGEGMWTGDNFLAGAIPPARARRVQGLIKDGKMLPLAQMIAMTSQEWRSGLNMRNYDQAWSMVHFLAHADDGKYQGAFVAFINDIARARPNEQAFSARIGNVEAFQKRYSEWWAELDRHPTADLYVQAVVQTLTSFLARAAAEKQTFETAQEFLVAAKAGALKCPQELWLPPALLESAVKPAERLKTWSLETGKAGQKLLLTQPDGTVFAGAYTPRYGQGPQVTVTVERPRPATQPAGVTAATSAAPR